MQLCMDMTAITELYRQLYVSTTCFGQYYFWSDRRESQFPLLLAAITTTQYQPASPSSLRYPTDTSGKNGELHEIIDVT